MRTPQGKPVPIEPRPGYKPSTPARAEFAEAHKAWIQDPNDPELSARYERAINAITEEREDAPQVAAVEAVDGGLGIASFETSDGAAYDAEAFTITRWHDVGVEVSNEYERLAFPWAVITKIELEAA